MKRWLAGLGLIVVLAQPAMAWRPAGWVYANYPYMYDHASQDWYWFGVNNVQWANGFPPADGWKRLNEGPLARGWTWHVWPYAYHHPGRAWHFFSANGRQRCVNLRTGVWSVFGQLPLPADMVRIPGGTNAGTDPDFGDYSLTVESFYMDAYEVTKALWDEVHAWAIINGYTFDNAGTGRAADHPVHLVNWYDCVKWCNARSEMAGRMPAYYTDAALTQVYRTGLADGVHLRPAANGHYLPTRTQWEYAARGGVAGRRFPWGDSDEIQHARANYYSQDFVSYDTSPTRGYHPSYNDNLPPWTYSAPVGSFAPNGYGLYDMAGNVWEWCFDLVGDDRMIRGGAWYSNSPNTRVGAHGHATPGSNGDNRGFRTALSQ